MRCALLVYLVLPVLLLACGDDGNEADRLGVAAACTTTDDCPEVEFNEDHIQLICLTNFKGGYCGLPDCVSSEDCPLGSTCVLHDDGETYCFRECVDKPDCNRHRPVEVEANCSGSFDFNDPDDDVGQKACIPPSSGI